MKRTALTAQIRKELGRKIKSQRQKLNVPAILYGKGIKNINLIIRLKDIQHLLKNYGANALINLKIGEKKPILVFLQDIQRDAVSDQIIHCDLWKIDPKKEIKTEIPIKITGEAPAVTELEGVPMQNKNSLHISALPENLVSEIEVDISNLKTFEDKIQIKDISVKDNIKILDDPEETVFSIQEPRSEEELEELEEKPSEDVEKIEVEEKGKEDKEDEEGQEDQKEKSGEEKPAEPQK